MKKLVNIVILVGLLPPLGIAPFCFSQEVHGPVTLDTKVRVPGASSGYALDEIVTVGSRNHIPLGIILMDTPNSDYCQARLKLDRGTMTVAGLIAAVRAAVPGYRAELEDGVLDVIPVNLPKVTSRFLRIKLAHFHSAPGTHQDLGYDLWSVIRGILAPGASTDSSHFFSLSAERVPGMDVRDQTVKSTLNLIVGQGGGGVWILRTSRLKALSAKTPMPFQIYGYTGDRRIQTGLCAGSSRR